MSVERFQANIPFVNSDGRTTTVSQVFLDKLISELIALRAEVNDHEARIAALEP